MSTVLRPIGPREPRVYWFRRLVLLGILVVVIVAVAEACSGGGGTKHPSTHQSTPPTTPPTTPSTSTQVAACDPTVLQLELSTSETSYTSGTPVKLIGTFTNPAASPCTLVENPATEFWTVKSGPVKIWTTKGCVSQSVSKQVTIKAGGTKKVTTTWPGNRIGTTACSDGAAAEAGEYTADATLDGVKAPRAAVFHITS